MTLSKKEKAICGIAFMIFGFLLTIMKGQLIDLIAYIFGVIVIVDGIINIINKVNQLGIIKIVVGAILIFFGASLARAAIYIISVGILLLSTLYLIQLFRSKVTIIPRWKGILTYLNPILWIFFSVCILFNVKETMDAFCIVGGILIFIEGVLACLDLNVE